MGDFCLHDLLFAFLLYEYPVLLQDEAAFQKLHAFIHQLLVETARKEREATTRRLLNASRS
jgi:hypothetical protein